MECTRSCGSKLGEVWVCGTYSCGTCTYYVLLRLSHSVYYYEFRNGIQRVRCCVQNTVYVYGIVVWLISIFRFYVEICMCEITLRICTLYTVHCALYSVQCTLYILLHSVHICIYILRVVDIQLNTNIGTLLQFFQLRRNLRSEFRCVQKVLNVRLRIFRGIFLGLLEFWLFGQSLASSSR